MNYKEFKEYYDENPDLDNLEYYEKYPETNKSTIRSWKSRAGKPIEIVDPTETEIDNAKGFEEQTDYLLQLLMTQTGSKESEFKGLDKNSQLILLKNRKSAQDKETKKSKPGSNSGILPAPLPPGRSNQEFGIDKYIEFDKQKNEIRMEIPMEVLLDPKKNKNLGLLQ